MVLTTQKLKLITLKPHRVSTDQAYQIEKIGSLASRNDNYKFHRHHRRVEKPSMGEGCFWQTSENPVPVKPPTRDLARPVPLILLNLAITPHWGGNWRQEMNDCNMLFIASTVHMLRNSVQSVLRGFPCTLSWWMYPHTYFWSDFDQSAFARSTLNLSRARNLRKTN